MFTRLRVENYKLFKEMDVSLGRFAVLVGPNSSGKSTFIDVFRFLRDCFSFPDLESKKGGVSQAVDRRGGSFEDLTFNGQGGEIGFYTESKVKIWEKSPLRFWERVAIYELRIASKEGRIVITSESLKRFLPLQLSKSLTPYPLLERELGSPVRLPA